MEQISLKNYLLIICSTLSVSAFISCGANHEPKQETETENTPEYAIAYNVLTDSESDNYEVFTMNLDGSEKRNITHLKGVEWTYYSHRDKLYFISDQDTCQRCAYFLYETNSRGEQPRKVSDIPLADSWMSSRKDGREFMVKPNPKTDSAFYLIDQNGKLLQRLETGLPSFSDPLFIDDGLKVVFRGGNKKSKRESGYREELYVINANGDGLKQLTHYPEADTTAPWYAYQAGVPKLHPTENFITYQSFQAGKYSLYAVTPDGSEQWKLTDNSENEGWHEWSPDGKWLAIELFDNDQTQFHIGLMNWETKTMKILTDTTYQYQQAPNFVLKSSSPLEIRGVYGHPQPLWEKGYRLDELGVNAIFVHSGSIKPDMITRARAEGLKIFAEFATLNGKNYVQEHPEARAINESGEPVEAASWFMGACPTEPGFRRYRFDQLRELLTNYELDGVWMDYVHWHAQFEEPVPILPETCFCDHCLDRFSKDADIQLPSGTTAEKAQWILANQDSPWRDWRCGIILEWAQEMKSILQEIRPGALLGLYHCPWDDEEFDGARRRILGLDYDLLKGTIDVFSPMVYHERMGRSPDWVAENINWFCERLDADGTSGPKVWPIVQAHNDPGVVSTSEFETVLRGGLSGCSSGVMMFTTRSVAEEEGKVEILRRVYGER